MRGIHRSPPQRVTNTENVSMSWRHHLCLTHWGWVTHICVSKLTVIGSDNGLSPDRRQANIWINGGILLIWTLGTNSSEIANEIHTFSFKNGRLKMSSAKWRPFCIGLKSSLSKLLIITTHFEWWSTYPQPTPIPPHPRQFTYCLVATGASTKLRITEALCGEFPRCFYTRIM